MAYPVKNTFVHFHSDSDSSSDDEASMLALRKCKSSPSVSSLCQVADTLAGGSDQYGEAKMKLLSSRISVDIMSTRDTLERLTFDTMPTFGRMELLPHVCIELCEGNRDERVDIQETFMDYDERHDHDFEMLQRRKCSDERRSQKVHTEESPRMAFHATELCTQTTVSEQKPQRTTLPQDATVEDPYRGPESRRPKMQGCTPSKRNTHKCDTMPSTLDLKGENDELIVGVYAANASFEVISEPVTTLMVCNLPCRLCSQGLKRAVDELGFAGSYDLIHVPKGFRNFMGYGFITLKEPQVVASFMVAISNYTFPGNSNKQPYCRVAACQNFKTNLKRIQRGLNYRKRAQVPVLS